MRRLIRHLMTAWMTTPCPPGPAPGAWAPPFPMIDGGALACPDLAASLATLAFSYPRTTDA